MMDLIGNIVGVRREGNPGNYMGFPTLVGRNKREIPWLQSRIIIRV